MDTVLFYITPFLRNLGILYTVVFAVYLGFAIKRSGINGFSFVIWLEDNRNRFVSAGVFIFCLAFLMAITDVAPLFKVLGFDINATPVGLGLAIAAFLGFIDTTARKKQTKTKEKAEEIQLKGQEIIKASADIVDEEARPKVAKPKPKTTTKRLKPVSKKK